MQLDLTTLPIPEAIRRIALPASVGLFFLTMFNVVDTYFAGRISTEALAALSASFPVFFLLVSAGNGLATGATACIGGALGAGDLEKAEGYARQTLLLAVAAGAVITAVGLLAAPLLFRLLGASGTYLDACLAYMDVIFAFAVFFMLAYLLNGILQATGDTVCYRNFLVGSFLLNCVLDPWFIHGGLGVPAMGVGGVALATALCHVWGCWLLGRAVLSRGMPRLRRLSDLRPDPALFLDILRQGLPSCLNYLTIGIGIFVITYYLSVFGPEVVAAYGVATRIEQIVLLPGIGINIAVLALVAQNHGARRPERIRETLRVALRLGAVVMGVGGVLVHLGADWLMRQFTADASVIEAGASYLRLAAFVLYAYVILFVNVAALQGVRKPMFGVWVGLARQIVAPLLVFHLGVHVLEWGLFSVWWGIACIVWTAAMVSWLVANRILKRTLLQQS